MATLLLPTSHSFPNIRLQQELGRGSEGCVFLATHKSPNSSNEKTVAVKVLDKRKWRRSASFDMVSELHHPNIMPCIAVEEKDDKLAVVMKRAKGGDLHSWIARNGPLEMNLVRKLFAQLLSAVAHIHQLGLAHRDIKPENILMNARHDHIWLCDFGYAELIVPATTTNHTGASPFNQDSVEWDAKVRGTLHYAAPEVLLASSDMMQLMPAADIWSCGVVLAFMLTGTLPFHEPSDYDTFHMITTGSWTRPSIVNSNPCLKDLFAKLFEMNPAMRISANDALGHAWMIQSDDDSELSSESMTGRSSSIDEQTTTIRRRSGSALCFSSPRRRRQMRGLPSITEE